MATITTPKPRRRRSDEAKRTIQKLNQKLDTLHDRSILILGVLLGLVVTLLLGFMMVDRKIEGESTNLKNEVGMKIEGEIFALMHLKRDFNERIESKILEIDGKVDEWSQKLQGGDNNHADDATSVSKVDESEGKMAGTRLWGDSVARIKGFFRIPKKENVVKGFVSTKEHVLKGFVSTKEDAVKGFVSKKENVVRWFKEWRSVSVEKKTGESLDEIKGLPTPIEVVEEDIPAQVLGQVVMIAEKRK